MFLQNSRFLYTSSLALSNLNSTYVNPNFFKPYVKVSGVHLTKPYFQKFLPNTLGGIKKLPVKAGLYFSGLTECGIEYIKTGNIEHTTKCFLKETATIASQSMCEAAVAAAATLPPPFSSVICYSVGRAISKLLVKGYLYGEEINNAKLAADMLAEIPARYIENIPGLSSLGEGRFYLGTTVETIGKTVIGFALPLSESDAATNTTLLIGNNVTSVSDEL